MEISETEALRRVNSTSNILQRLHESAEKTESVQKDGLSEPEPAEEEVTPSALETNLELKPLHPGNRKNIPNLDEMTKGLVLMNSKLGVPQAVTAETFGISQTEVSQISLGNRPLDSSIKKKIDDTVDHIHVKAMSAMMDAMTEVHKMIPNMKKAKDISSVARDMSTIIKNTRPAAPPQVNNTKVIVYSPTQRTEDDYEVLTVQSA